MLSIGSLNQGANRYFTSTARADYYTEGGEPLGHWYGRGAAALGLDGHVAPEHLDRLFRGFGPDGHALVQNAGRLNRHPAWDLTFSAPKSVSVLWGVLDREGRNAIETAHRAAVEKAVGFLEREAVLTRRGKLGTDTEPAHELIVAAFQHGTSRAMESQLHTHALAINAARRADGTWGTIVGQPLFDHKMLAGTLYRAELALGLERIGLEVVRGKGGMFDVAGVPASLLDAHSTRRKQVLAEMRKHGEVGAKAAARATLRTRPKKEHVARQVLLKDWAALAEAHGFSKATILFRGKPIQRDHAAGFEEAARETVDSLSKDKPLFSERDFLTCLADRAPGRGVTFEQVLNAGRAHLATSRDLVRLGRVRGENEAELLYTTRAIHELEARLLSHISAAKEARGAAVPMKKVEAAIAAAERERGYRLSPEQRDAVLHLTQAQGSMRVLEGLAGTGKTASLDATRRAFHAAGYRVIGATISGKAARGLENETKIRTRTLASLLATTDGTTTTWEAFVATHKAGIKVKTAPERTLWQAYAEAHRAARRFGGFKNVRGFLKYMEKAKSPSKQWGFRSPAAFLRYMRKVKGRAPELDAKTVLVVDEAGMVGTPDMLKVVERARAAGASILWVGDSRQLQPVDAIGGGFRAMGDILGRAQMKDILRQKEEWQRRAVASFAQGDARIALREYATRGFVHVAEDRKQAMEQLVKEWAWNGGSKRPEEHLILTGTRGEAFLLNSMAQDARRMAGGLGQRAALVNQQRIHAGDRVLFTENSTRIGVQNGTMGTVEEVARDRRTLAVKLDGGKKATVDTESYRGVHLGYAATSHKLQGATVDNAYVLAGGPMQDQTLSYVQASRARKDTRFYTERREAGDTLTELAREMARDRTRRLTIDPKEWDEDLGRLKTPKWDRESS